MDNPFIRPIYGAKLNHKWDEFSQIIRENSSHLWQAQIKLKIKSKQVLGKRI